MAKTSSSPTWQVISAGKTTPTGTANPLPAGRANSPSFYIIANPLGYFR